MDARGVSLHPPPELPPPSCGRSPMPLLSPPGILPIASALPPPRASPSGAAPADTFVPLPALRRRTSGHAANFSRAVRVYPGASHRTSRMSNLSQATLAPVCKKCHRPVIQPHEVHCKYRGPCAWLQQQYTSTRTRSSSTTARGCLRRVEGHCGLGAPPMARVVLPLPAVSSVGPLHMHACMHSIRVP